MRGKSAGGVTTARLWGFGGQGYKSMAACANPGACGERTVLVAVELHALPARRGGLGSVPRGTQYWALFREKNIMRKMKSSLFFLSYTSRTCVQKDCFVVHKSYMRLKKSPSKHALRGWMVSLPFSKHALLVNLVDLGCGKKTTSGSGKKTTGVRAFVPPDLIVRANNCP